MTPADDHPEQALHGSSPVREPPQVRLARSRAELLELFEPSPGEGQEARRGGNGHFPRSATMRFFSRGQGTGGMLVMLLALFALSPTKALRLLRMLPLNTISRIVIARLINARGAKP